MPFGFRLRFLAVTGSYLRNQAREVTFSLPGAPGPLVLRHAPKREDALPSAPEVFTIDCDGFGSEEVARLFGLRLKTALSVYSARLGLGFDLGEDRSTSGVGQIVRDMYREQGINIRPTVHGLDIFDTSLLVKRIEVHATASVTRAVPQDFPENLATEFKERALAPKHMLALSLYNASHHESDPEIRFLSLVTVIEVLATRDLRSNSVAAFLDACSKNLDSAPLSASEREAMSNGLGNLKRESVSESCLRLVQAANADLQLFRKCYKARSELLHDGVSTTYLDLPKQPHLLDDLVRHVLLSVVDSASPEPQVLPS